MIVLFNGAVDRKKSDLPVFQRRTWIDDIDANVLILDDPTLQMDDEMSVGWYIGSKNENPVFLNRNDADGERGIWNKEDIYGKWNVSIKEGNYNFKFKFIIKEVGVHVRE